MIEGLRKDRKYLFYDHRSTLLKGLKKHMGVDKTGFVNMPGPCMLIRLKCDECKTYHNFMLGSMAPDPRRQ